MEGSGSDSKDPSSSSQQSDHAISDSYQEAYDQFFNIFHDLVMSDSDLLNRIYLDKLNERKEYIFSSTAHYLGYMSQISLEIIEKVFKDSNGQFTQTQMNVLKSNKERFNRSLYCDFIEVLQNQGFLLESGRKLLPENTVYKCGDSY